MSLKDAFAAQRTTQTAPVDVATTFATVEAPAPEELARLTLRLPKSLHRRIKSAALDKDMTAQAYVIAAVEMQLERDAN